MNKNFSIFKNKPSDNDKLPTHSISMKVGEEYINIGACWVKNGTNGSFLSCKLSNAWVDSKDNTKSRKSYVIVAEEEIELPKEPIIDPKTGTDLSGGDF